MIKKYSIKAGALFAVLACLLAAGCAKKLIVKPTEKPVAPPEIVTVNAPSDLTASSDNESVITLFWKDNADNEAGYAVERSTDGENFEVIEANLPADTVSYRDTGLGEGAYYYRVAGFNDSAKSDYSNVASDSISPITKEEPAEPSLRGKEFKKDDNLQIAYFGYDDAVLTGDARAILAKDADWLRKNPGVEIIIEGHCDERGTVEYNLALGDRRAKAARSYLMKLGVKGGRIATISYGEEKPADLGHDEDAWAKNRRAELLGRIPPSGEK
jgi:peptidoglycan-associated lipoprotein